MTEPAHTPTHPDRKRLLPRDDNWSFDGEFHRSASERESSPNFGVDTWGPRATFDFHSVTVTNIRKRHGRSQEILQ